MDFTIIGEAAFNDLTRTPERTFGIEETEAGEILLHLKLSPTQSLSVINGAPIALYISPPSKSPIILTFEIHEIKDAAFWISREYRTLNARDIVTKLSTARSIRVVIYDWNIKCICSESFPLTTPDHSIDEWYATTPSSVLSISTDPDPSQSQHQGHYKVTINTHATKPSLLHYNHAFRTRAKKAKPYVIGSNKYSEHLNIENYLANSSHGFYQEHAIAEQLLKVFIPQTELFVSPKLKDKTELTDFLIAYNRSIILIESKSTRPFEGTQRTIEASEASTTELLSKAFRQLAKARHIVTNDVSQIIDQTLATTCSQAITFISLCAIDDVLIVNSKALTQRLRLEKNEQTSLILEVEALFGLLQLAKSKHSFVHTLRKLQTNMPSPPALPLIHPELKPSTSI
jgi:hypothetical protein